VPKSQRKNAERVQRAGVPHDASNTQAYEALAAFNRDVEQVLADLERLGALGVLPKREQHRFLKACRATLEETRAWTNFEFIDVLRQKEEGDWAYFARIHRQAEKSSDLRSP
jgi:hypothetical protein